MSGVIDLSNDGQHVEAWHNGTRCLTAAVAVYGLHGAMGKCLAYLREWSGAEPTIAKGLKAKLDEADAAFARMAFGADYR
jgi:hypothetical protein